MEIPSVTGVLVLSLLIALPAAALSEVTTHQDIQQEAALTSRAEGTFEVQLTPQPADEGDESGLRRMTIDKRFHGDLEGTSQGQMLAAMTPVESSAGYVAVERVSGTLHGRHGSFTLQHSGTMDRGASRLSVTVVPDSGTDELVGLEGEMAIIITDGKHSYEFDYTLPAAR